MESHDAWKSLGLRSWSFSILRAKHVRRPVTALLFSCSFRALSLNVPAQLGLQITLGRPLGLALSTLIFSYRSPETKLMTAATLVPSLPFFWCYGSVRKGRREKRPAWGGPFERGLIATQALSHPLSLVEKEKRFVVPNGDRGLSWSAQEEEEGACLQSYDNLRLTDQRSFLPF